MEDGNTVTVNQITHVQSNKYMKIDSETLFALHIFSNKKKGYSLYTLLNRCKSKIGKQCLKKIMLRPLLDPVEIQKRQDGVELFLKSSVKEVVARLNAFLMRIGSVDSILHKIAKCTTSPLDFVVLMKGLGAMISIVDILNNDLRNILIGQVRALEQQERTEQTEAEMYLLMRQIALVENLVDECNVAELQYLLDQMNGTIDQEATSMKKDSVVIQYGVYQDLDNDREIYDRMDGELLLSL
jgi:DNA mismatch repair ATPase MutS